MKRILINATHAEEIRVALCKDNHVYDFDLENRTREQKKANIYKGHVTRVEPSLEAVFVEYGSERQGFLSIREISREYLTGNPRETKNIRDIITEGTELLVQVEKEERGNKGAALSTYISLAGRYLVLMPNNASGGGISRQISGSVRDEMKRMLARLNLPKGMSVIVRTAGIGRTQEDLQNDLNHLLDIWKNINTTAKNTPSPCLTHREAGVVTRAVRDYLRDDIAEVWIDNEQAYNEAYHFVNAVMPHQVNKLRKYLEFEPMFSNFGIESQIETAYQREVKLPSGGSIVIDQTEALVSIDINSAKSTRGGDVESTAYHTNLEAADEIARQLRLRDMGGLIVIDFIDMLDEKHRKDVESRIKDATQYDRARIQFASISRFGLLEMSRQRLRPSLEEATGYVCPRCHGNGVIRDLRSLSLSIMRNIEKIALKEGRGEVQAEVPIEIGAFLLNEKRDALVYLEQDSGARITILPHSHLETPHYKITFNQAGYAPSSYERVSDVHAEQTQDLGYETNWQTAENKPAPHQRQKAQQRAKDKSNKHNKHNRNQNQHNNKQNTQPNQSTQQNNRKVSHQNNGVNDPNRPEVCAWLSNLFTPPVQAQTSDAISSADAAAAIENHVNSGAASRGVNGTVDIPQSNRNKNKRRHDKNDNNTNKNRHDKHNDNKNNKNRRDRDDARDNTRDTNKNELPKREANSKRPSRGERDRNKQLETVDTRNKQDKQGNKRNSRNERRSERNSQPNPNDVVVNIDKSPKQLDTAQHINIDVETGNVAKTPLVTSAETIAPVPERNIKSANADTAVSAQTTSIPKPVKALTETTEVVEKKVAPHLLGRAKNDPRDTGKAVAVTGTMHTFVTTQLGSNAQAEIAEKGIITCFIQVLNAAKNSANTPPIEINEETVQAYRASIAPVAQAASVAGTANTHAPSPAFRALNDPRGQIAGFEAIPEALKSQSFVSDTPVQTEAALTDITARTETDTNAKPKVDTTKENMSETKPTQKVSLQGLTAGNFVQQQLGTDAHVIISEQSFEAALVKAFAKLSESSVTPQTLTEPAPVETETSAPAQETANTENAEVVSTSSDSEHTQEGTETDTEKKPAKKTTRKPRKKPAAETTDATDTKSEETADEKPAKPKKPKATRQRRTSKKATADKVTVTKKVPTSDEPVNEAGNDSMDNSDVQED